MLQGHVIFGTAHAQIAAGLEICHIAIPQALCNGFIIIHFGSQGLAKAFFSLGHSTGSKFVDHGKSVRFHETCTLRVSVVRLFVCVALL
jgi:hypothetical protein